LAGRIALRPFKRKDFTVKTIKTLGQQAQARELANRERSVRRWAANASPSLRLRKLGADGHGDAVYALEHAGTRLTSKSMHLLDVLDELRARRTH